MTVASALVMPISVPVPEEYAAKFDKKNPSTYDQYTVFTGPYMVRNNAEGKAVGRDPGKSIEIVRNPNWDAKTDFRPAYLDEIRIEEGNDDLTIASRRTLQGDGLMCCDSGQPPIPILRRALTSNKDQVGRTASGGTRWIALRTDKKPFDNINVRKAVIAAFDREALLLTRGGRFVGPIAQHYIPPGTPGFEESGGEKGFPEFDFMQNPKGDAELARQYMLKAKAEGVPVSDDGRYTGGEKLLTIATNADPGLQTATVAQSQLEELGFKLNFRQVPQDTLYTRFCNVPGTGLGDLPERRLVPRLHGPAVAAGADVQGRGDQAAGQRQLLHARRAGDRRRHDEGGDDPRGAGAQQGVGGHQPPGRRAGARDPVRLGRLVQPRVRGRPGGRERLHDRLGLRVLLHQVGRPLPLFRSPPSACGGAGS